MFQEAEQKRRLDAAMAAAREEDARRQRAEEEAWQRQEAREDARMQSIRLWSSVQGIEFFFPC